MFTIYFHTLHLITSFKNSKYVIQNSSFDQYKLHIYIYCTSLLWALNQNIIPCYVLFIIFCVVESLVTIFLIQCTFDNHCYPTTNMCIIYIFIIPIWGRMIIIEFLQHNNFTSCFLLFVGWNGMNKYWLEIHQMT